VYYSANISALRISVCWFYNYLCLI